MRLSILIPSIPSRFEKAQKLYEDILSMIGEDYPQDDIEVLMLVDNKKRTIGEKREALKNISRGKYFMFVDDDDSLLSVNEIYLATDQDVDVITFKQKCFNSDGSEFIVTFGLGNKIEHNIEKGNYIDCNRPPFPACAWASKFKRISYPDISYGEDGVWIKKALKKAKSEYFIDKILHSYNFNPIITEASTESNKYWKNPNPKQARCIVNFFTVSHSCGASRLYCSLSDSGIKFIDFTYRTLDCPLHEENPYAFKVYAIQEAKRREYNQILWLDASVYAVKDISPVFDWITKNGFFLEDSGHKVGEWCNDRTLNYYGITREQAMQMTMISSGFVGIDFNNPVGVELFDRLRRAMLDGQFIGSWDDHRHDQTCLSIAACQMGLESLISPNGQFFAYIGEAYGPPQETAVCALQGIR